jgi:hypothetical protein
LMHQLETQRKKGAMWSFTVARSCGMVYSDGTKTTQITPYQASETGGCWWLVVFAKDVFGGARADGSYPMVAYCQEQALSGGRAWSTHASRIFFLEEATQQMHQPIIVQTPGVVIEEIDSEEEAEEATHQMHQPIIVQTPGVVIIEIDEEEEADDFLWV